MSKFECAARRQGTAGGNYPADCLYPDCACEPNILPSVPTGELFNELLRRINFDGMDPRTFSLAELQRAIPGAEWPAS